MRPSLSAALWLAATALFSLPVQSQIETPAEFLGYELGDRFTRHHKVVDYAQSLADGSDRAVWMPYGRTSEYRDLGLLIVTSKANHARLESLRQANLARTEGKGLPADDPGVAFVYLSYNVHGNEAVCTEAALRTMHALVSGEDAGGRDVAAWLDQAVVLIDPCVNPDGRDRYVAFQDRTSGLTPDADLSTVEHDEPWPGGRSNHFMFDMNRDWAWQTQVETQGRVTAYRHWMPQVHVDFHEQGINSPYYFAPAAEPFHKIISPWQRKCQEHIGANNARWFDARGALYFTREVFDLFYPAYGDTWPLYNGAIGMTYEQGGSGRAGRAALTSLGDTLTLAYRIQNHHESGLSTVEESVRRAGELVEEFADYHQRNIEAPFGAYRGYVFPARQDAAKMAELRRLLDANGIDYGTAPAASGVRVYDYATGRTGKRTVRQGDLLIDARQPHGGILQVLMDPDPVLSDSMTYDITAWALPHALGLDALALTSALSVAGEWVKPARAQRATGPEQAYAWVLPGNGADAIRGLASLLKDGVTVRRADTGFTVEGQVFAAGDFVITRRNNEGVADMAGALARASQAAGTRALAVTSGRVTSGYDFGSSHYDAIQAPRVATIVGPGVSSLSAGEIWHHFETKLDYPLNRVGAMDELDLDNLDVVILPSGWYRMGDDERSALADWVRSGGQLVAVGGACSAFAGQDGWGLERYADGERAEIEAAEEAVQEAADERNAHDRAAQGLDPLPFIDRGRDRLRYDLPGAIFRAAVDDSHPLADGYSTEYMTLRTSGRRYAALEDGNVAVLLPADHGRPFSGHAGEMAIPAQAGSLVAGVQNMGRGSVVYLVDNPLFRAFWKSGHRFFENAVFLGPSM
jgi:putative intracellular protease/amidase